MGGAKETARVEAFSDGVFAIAITLLVLELKAPKKGAGSLWHGLVHEWPQFAGYLVSFFIIGIMWVNHHSMFKQFVRSDRASSRTSSGLVRAEAPRLDTTPMLKLRRSRRGTGLHRSKWRYRSDC